MNPGETRHESALERQGFTDHGLRHRHPVRGVRRRRRLERTRARALAAHHRRHHLDRPALLLQCGAGAGPRRGRRGQGRAGRRGHHQIRRAARAAVVPLVGRRDLVDRVLVSRPCGRARGPGARDGGRRIQRLPVRHRRRRVAGNDHAVQRLGLHLAEPAEDPRSQACDRRAEGRRAQDGAVRVAHNYILSIPMLLCMAGATHGLPF